MKKLFIALFLTATAMTSVAQVKTSRSFFKRSVETTWYARLGLSVNNAAGWGDALKDTDTSAGSNAGSVVDFGFQKPIGKSGLYWGMELGFNQRGFKVSETHERHDYESTYQEKETMKFSAWDFHYSPFTLGYKYAITDKLKVDAHLGIYVSVDMTQSCKETFENRYGDKTTEDGEEDFENRFDAGIQAGIGVWYGKFNLDFTYLRGFIPMIDFYDYYDYKSLYQSNFAIRIGYAF